MVIRAWFRGRSLAFKPNLAIWTWQPLWCSYFVGFIYSLQFFQKTEQISCLLSLLGHWGTVNNSSEALHLHNATEAGWGLESNTVQSFRFHKEGLWDQLCRDTTCSSACQLPHQAHLLLWPALLWGGAATRIQAFPTHSGELWIISRVEFSFLCVVHFFMKQFQSTAGGSGQLFWLRSIMPTPNMWATYPLWGHGLDEVFFVFLYGLSLTRSWYSFMLSEYSVSHVRFSKESCALLQKAWNHLLVLSPFGDHNSIFCFQHKWS